MNHWRIVNETLKNNHWMHIVNILSLNKEDLNWVKVFNQVDKCHGDHNIGNYQP